MYLKSLEIQGFKSFPDKTQISFMGGLTAVVGPNGSGKSNISDAIRWVLGEQSTRALRGAKMEDVIFSGTDTRSAVGFASVSLIFDNTDNSLPIEYSEVMVTRRYYRSGESEFYINKKPVRLKHITELFMDTGLGRDGYSVIGQGKIDEILSIKSEDRREIFEEAAGISKFRYKKDEALRKLKHTQENLVRINDILVSTEGQLVPLEKASEKAKRYLVLFEKLKGLETKSYYFKLESIKAEIEENNEKLTISQNDFNTQTNLKDTLFKETEKIDADNIDKEIEIEAVRRSILENEAKFSSIKSEIAVLNEKMRGNMESIGRIKENLDLSHNKISDNENQINIHKDEIQSLNESLEEILKREGKLLEDISLLKEENAKLDLLKEESQTHIAAFENTIKSYEISISAINSSISNIENLLNASDNTKENIEKEEKNNRDLKLQLENIEDEITSCHNMLDGIALKNENSENKKNKLQSQYESIEKEYSEKISRLKLLSDMQSSYQGFSSFAQKVMQSKNILKGIKAPVSSLIKTSSDYALAIETALGAAGSNIVTENSKSAKDAIEYLKRINGGRGTFLPLDVIKPMYLSEKLDNEDGFIGIASKLVSFDSEFSNIIENILGRTVIATDLTASTNIARKFGNKFRVVSLDGQVVNAGGSLTGGSRAYTSGSIARAAEIESLTDNSTKLKEKLVKIKEDFELANSQFKTVLAQKENIDIILSGHLMEKTKLTATINQQSQLLESLLAFRDNFNKQQEENKARIKSLSLEKDEILAKKAESEESLVAEQNKLSDYIAGSSLNEIAKMRDTSFEIQSEINITREKIANKQQTILNLETLSLQFSSEKGKSSDLILAFENENEEIKVQNAENELFLENSANEGEKLKQQLDEKTNEKLLLSKKRSENDREINEITEQILKIQSESGKFSNKLVVLETENRKIIERLWDVYELSPSMLVKPESDVTADDESEITTLRSQIRSLGTVSVDSIEDYANLKQQFDFMTEQKDDIEKAKSDIEKTIDTLLSSMEEIFAVEFEKLNVEFSRTFKEIFEGGSAELILMDKNDILNCPIEINVSLPGKKLKTLTLLSGGEKAFVAIALYFAILKVRPTPFCILDEIDAALDDVNVNRFAHYLEKMLGKTQFLIITHRRGTMEKANMLYGVTMQKRGISKLLVLNADEVEKELNIKTN